MRHRDSVGIKQEYGNGAVQYLTAGRGVLHEEMWALDGWGWHDIELYQIWVNLPSYDKGQAPSLQLTGTDQPDPLPVVQPTPGVEIRVVLGQAHGKSSSIKTATPMSVLHVTLDPGAVWEYSLPSTFNAFMYTRRGSVVIPQGAKRGSEDVKINTHETCFFRVRDE